MHTELGSSQVEVQQCALSWEVGEPLGLATSWQGWQGGSGGGRGGGEEEGEEAS